MKFFCRSLTIKFTEQQWQQLNKDADKMQMEKAAYIRHKLLSTGVPSFLQQRTTEVVEARRREPRWEESY